jgi:hypothetical protein
MALPAVVVRILPAGRLCETSHGELILVREGYHRLPAPGCVVTVPEPGPASWNGVLRCHVVAATSCEFTPAAPADLSAALDAERACIAMRLEESRNGLVLQAPRPGGRPKPMHPDAPELLRIVSSGTGPAVVSLVLGEIMTREGRPEDATRVLLEAGRRFLGAGGTNLAVARALGKAGQPGHAVEVLAALVDRMERAPMTPSGTPRHAACAAFADRVRTELATVALNVAAAEASPAALPEHAREALQRLAKLPGTPGEELAKAVSLVARRPDLQRGVAMWRRLGFHVAPHRSAGEAVSLVLKPEPQNLGGLTGTILPGDVLVVHILDRSPAPGEVANLRTQLQEWARAQPSGRCVGVIIHPEVHDLANLYARLNNETELLLVPLDAAVLNEPEESAEDRVQGTLRYWILKQDLFQEMKAVTGHNFFGRRIDFLHLVQVLGAGHHVGLFGLRRVGKSSFLRELRNRASSHLVVLIDLQDPISEVAPLWYRLATSLRDAVAERDPNVAGSIDWRLGHLATLWVRASEGAVKAALEADLRSVLEASISRSSRFSRVLFAFDELEHQRDRDEDILVQLFAWLKAQAQYSNGRVQILASSAHPVVAHEPRLANRDNPLFGLLQHRYLVGFSPEELRDMLSRLGAQMGVEFEPEALDRIHSETAGHPWLARSLCSAIFHGHGNPRTITLGMVEGSVHPFLLDKRDFGRYVLDKLQREAPLEYEMLVQIAARQQAREPAPAEQTLQEGQLLMHLLDLGLVTAADAGYRVASALMRRWVLDRAAWDAVAAQRSRTPGGPE